MGIQGAGKSSDVARYLERGYERLNRDLLGGDLDDLIPKLADLLAAGRTRVVLDNTYATRVSRYPLIRTAHAHGVPVRCRYLATPIDEAYANVVSRILERHGRLLGPDELKELGKDDPNLPPPAAMATFRLSAGPAWPKSTDGAPSGRASARPSLRRRVGVPVERPIAAAAAPPSDAGDRHDRSPPRTSGPPRLRALRCR